MRGELVVGEARWRWKLAAAARLWTRVDPATAALPGTEILVQALLVLVQRSHSEKTLLTILTVEGPSVPLQVSLQ